MYYDRSNSVLSQADKYPVLGAEAVWHFKQGLSEKLRLAIAGSSDDDLHFVGMQAKRVDAELNLHVIAPANISTTNKVVLTSGAPTKRGATGVAAGTLKRAKGEASDPALLKVRVQMNRCTKCSVEKGKHTTGLLGTGCRVTTQTPAAADEIIAIGKLKA